MPRRSTSLPPMGFVSAEPTHRRGDVWLVDLGNDPSDPEQAFMRPALIVSDDALHHPRLRMVVVVPATSRLRRLSLHAVVQPNADNGLGEASAFQAEQVRAVSSRRLVRRLGRLGVEDRHAIYDILRSILALH